MSATPGELREVAVRVAAEAAALVRRTRAEGVAVAATKSSGVDVVTEIDRASEALVRTRLGELRPGDAVLGEEEGERAGSTGVRWVVDPVDGTVNLLYGIPEYAVSIAAEVDGQVVAGAVVDVVRDVVYAAALGQGATRDGVPLRVRPAAPVAERLVLTGFGYLPEVRAHQGACVARLLPLVRDVRRMGSCALDLCHVAEGIADAYVEEGPQPWDWAAGSLVVSEAGGRFARLPGTGPAGSPGTDPREVLVAGPAEGWDELVDLLVHTGFLNHANASGSRG
ncbi:inositol monophosphatase family protein [Nocardioides campestrisoli]|uniref:inositol monophosphatase family protein n=1 Tax=Nocardioides campestrisoli TaxID=2736757 RepID=UPI00163D4911|nr:inositol monophosphatase family protein [Nocardioides campestrisoli]